MEYDKIDPIGLERIEWMLGLLMCMFANVNIKPGAKPFRVEDFVPDYGGMRKDRIKPMSGEDMLAAFRGRRAELEKGRL